MLTITSNKAYLSFLKKLSTYKVVSRLVMSYRGLIVHRSNIVV